MRFIFETVGIIIILLLLFATAVYVKFPTRSKKLFLSFCFVTLFSLGLSILADLNSQVNYENIPLKNFVAVLLMLSVYLQPVIYSASVLSIIHEHKNPTLIKKLLVLIPGAVDFLLIVTSPFTHLIMYIDERGIFTTGPFFILQYVILLYYLMYGIFELVSNYQNISRKQITFIAVFSFTAIIAAMFQILNQAFFAMSLASAVSLLFFYFILLNPIEYTDSRTGFFNSDAFKEFLITKRVISKGGAICIIHIKNTETAKKQYGIDEKNYLMKQFVKQIAASCKEKFLFYLSDNTFAFISDSRETGMTKLLTLLSYEPAPLFLSNGNSSLNMISNPFATQLFILPDVNKCGLNITKENQWTNIQDILGLIKYAIKSNPLSSFIKTIDESVLMGYKDDLKLKEYVNNAIKNEKFEVFLQPIFDVNKNKFTGAESLIRLKGEDGKYISPAMFIPEAEKNGSILKLGEISLKKTCEFIKQSKLDSLGINRVHINLSAVQCIQSDISDQIVSILKNYSVPNHMIRLEITETLLYSEPEKIIRIMDALSSQHISFALDDFGTGLSNISTLLTFPFSEIKFDKSLTDKIAENQKNSIPLKHLMSMIKEASMTVLVQGIETEEMSNLVKKFGCDEIQGFYYAKPMPLDEFVKFVSEKNKI